MSILYRSLQPPSSVTAAFCVHTSDGHDVVVQLQDTHLVCWRVASDGLEQLANWRAPASMLQMVHLPSGHILLLAEGGHCYLHRWPATLAAATAGAPPCEAHVQLQAPIASSSSLVQPYGCVVSSNVLSASAEQGMPSLTAVAYLPGVLHIIKASAVTPEDSDNSAGGGGGGSGQQGAQHASSSAGPTAMPAGTGGPQASMHLQAKAMGLSHALFSCHHSGEVAVDGIQLSIGDRRLVASRAMNRSRFTSQTLTPICRRDAA